jgi:hypothetical protein
VRHGLIWNEYDPAKGPNPLEGINRPTLATSKKKISDMSVGSPTTRLQPRLQNSTKKAPVTIPCPEFYGDFKIMEIGEEPDFYRTLTARTQSKDM